MTSFPPQPEPRRPAAPDADPGTSTADWTARGRSADSGADVRARGPRSADSGADVWAAAARSGDGGLDADRLRRVLEGLHRDLSQSRPDPAGSGAEGAFGSGAEGFGADQGSYGSGPDGYGTGPEDYGSGPEGYGSGPEGYRYGPEGSGSGPGGNGSARSSGMTGGWQPGGSAAASQGQGVPPADGWHTGFPPAAGSQPPATPAAGWNLGGQPGSAAAPADEWRTGPQPAVGWDTGSQPAIGAEWDTGSQPAVAATGALTGPRRGQAPPLPSRTPAPPPGDLQATPPRPLQAAPPQAAQSPSSPQSVLPPQDRAEPRLPVQPWNQFPASPGPAAPAAAAGLSQPNGPRTTASPAAGPAGPAAGNVSPAAGPATPAGEQARDGDEAWAMLAYLSVPFFSVLVPLAIFLARGGNSAFARRHAVQALNLAITVLLYNICVLILGGILAADTVGVALMIAVPVALVLWLVALACLIRAAVRASVGDFYQPPRWLCATIVR